MDQPIEGPGARRIAYLDGWRGAAIALVILGHFFFPNTGVASTGVEVFFVLSGRLMAEILFIESYPLKRFFLKRSLAGSWRRLSRASTSSKGRRGRSSIRERAS
jgi:peptidoglycan/LPS O-acetylase OafA/YrhL